MSDDENLDRAYALSTPAANRALYADWASDYDRQFADKRGYQLPALVAEAFARAGGQGPVLDIGAGTGLVAQELTERGISPVDGMDISPEMLAVAEEKRLYRRTLIGDITGHLEMGEGIYNGVVSAGTFTLGHVGPAALSEAVRIGAPGALYVLSINAEHWRNAGFAAKFAALEGTIENFSLAEVPIYTRDETSAHAADKGLIAIFNKMG